MLRYFARRLVSPLGTRLIIMSRPQHLLSPAFRLRDAISPVFGVRRIGGFSKAAPKTITVGDNLEFFLVEHAGHGVLALSERDRHLDVLTCISTTPTTVTISSSVQTNNLFGRVCMTPVASAHRLIVRSFLRRIKNSV